MRPNYGGNVIHDLVDKVLSIPPIWVYIVVGLLVFAEDAIFVGFVIPGETAAVLGGVDASRGHVNIVLIAAVVVVAAVVGDSVGYEIGRIFGPRVLSIKLLDKHRSRLDDARDLLARRGGWAVFLGRFIAFFRAVMPALAGLSKMPYRRFLFFNMLGGVCWGIGFVMLGYIAGNSYEAVSKEAGRVTALAVAGIVVIGLIVWRVRSHLRQRSEQEK
ncbi:DedA family protein [Skermania sp. ID1734]|uniref:DedA family protein n=1 Tax=Skermania sp. ID1734 TaxID=2597516 RepID=UPI002107C1A4|nr:DedA family protein [Skermania sp. ID1734]